MISFLQSALVLKLKFSDMTRDSKRQLGLNQSKPALMRKLFGEINLQENVSILFADIVGFTRLSSGLSAAELVAMLNDLFGRFDHICEDAKCEKVSTLVLFMVFIPWRYDYSIIFLPTLQIVKNG